MIQTISLYTILVWFIWGFFMGLGWALGTWVMNKILAGLG